MASTNGSEAVGPAAGSARRQAAAAQGAPTSQDPEVLAAQIERTREDLAETLDAIAEKVSPKRVADRTRKKVAVAVDQLKDRAVVQAGAAKEAAVGAKHKVVEQAGAAKERVQGVTSGQSGSVALGADSPTAFARPVGTADGALPPVTGKHVEGLDLTGTADRPAYVPPAPAGEGVRPEYVAGGAVALLLLLLLRRRRKRRRATVVVRGRRKR